MLNINNLCHVLIAVILTFSVDLEPMATDCLELEESFATGRYAFLDYIIPSISKEVTSALLLAA